MLINKRFWKIRMICIEHEGPLLWQMKDIMHTCLAYHGYLPSTMTLIEKVALPWLFSILTVKRPLSFLKTLVKVSEVMPRIVSSVKRFMSGIGPSLYFHVIVGMGLALNGSSIEVDVPAFRTSVSSIFLMNIGGAK